jgi:hypothetical protein
VLTRALGDTLAHDNFHLIGDQSGPVNYRRRVGSTGSDGCEVSESVRGSLGGLTWLPWFSPASGACRAPDDGLGIRASVSGSERANGAVDEPCRSRCVQNSGGFIIWRAAYLRTSAPPKPPASHGRTTVVRTLFVQSSRLSGRSSSGGTRAQRGRAMRRRRAESTRGDRRVRGRRRRTSAVAIPHTTRTAPSGRGGG